jgi:hypothetical protein
MEDCWLEVNNAASSCPTRQSRSGEVCGSREVGGYLSYRCAGTTIKLRSSEYNFNHVFFLDSVLRPSVHQ